MGGLLLASWRSDAGQGASEYALLIASIVVLVIAVMFGFRAEIEALIGATGVFMRSVL